MTAVYFISGLLAAGLCLYLLYALIKPESF